MATEGKDQAAKEQAAKEQAAREQAAREQATKDSSTHTATKGKDAPVTDTLLRSEEDQAEIIARHDKLLLEQQQANAAAQPAEVSVTTGDKASNS